MSLGPQVNAPWTQDQVASLNSYQASGRFHPFTGERGPKGEETALIATKEGWVEKDGGPVVQTWAHQFMTDWTWDHPRGSSER
jgi:hypothetical protein